MQDPLDGQIGYPDMTDKVPGNPATFSSLLAFLLFAQVPVSPRRRIHCQTISGASMQIKHGWQFASWGIIGCTAVVRLGHYPEYQIHINELSFRVTFPPTTTVGR
ncbi:hypothetical protein TNCV_4030981 [Trichonephila clavipes]|nr:hypothetical protein TNCV_4030981 [Trichonephila clavipes]